MTIEDAAGPPVDQLTYTEASRELDDIVAFFEQREIDVDQLVSKLERATSIIDELDHRLRRTRAQVEELVPRLEAVVSGGAGDQDGEPGAEDEYEEYQMDEVNEDGPAGWEDEVDENANGVGRPGGTGPDGGPVNGELF